MASQGSMDATADALIKELKSRLALLFSLIKQQLRTLGDTANKCCQRENIQRSDIRHPRVGGFSRGPPTCFASLRQGIPRELDTEYCSTCRTIAEDSRRRVAQQLRDIVATVQRGENDLGGDGSAATRTDHKPVGQITTRKYLPAFGIRYRPK